MSRASEDAMNALHGTLADTFRAEIARLRAAGEPIPPSLLAAAARFLKDNGVDAPGRVSPAVDSLAFELADLDFEQRSAN